MCVVRERASEQRGRRERKCAHSARLGACLHVCQSFIFVSPCPLTHTYSLTQADTHRLEIHPGYPSQRGGRWASTAKGRGAKPAALSVCLGRWVVVAVACFGLGHRGGARGGWADADAAAQWVCGFFSFSLSCCRVGQGGWSERELLPRTHGGYFLED